MKKSGQLGIIPLLLVLALILGFGNKGIFTKEATEILSRSERTKIEHIYEKVKLMVEQVEDKEYQKIETDEIDYNGEDGKEVANLLIQIHQIIASTIMVPYDYALLDLEKWLNTEAINDLRLKDGELEGYKIYLNENK